MHTRSIFLFVIMWLSMDCLAQQPAQRGLRVVDSLSAAEKNVNRIILQKEVDSIINEYVRTLPKTEEEPLKEPVKEGQSLQTILSILIIVMLGSFMIYYFRQQKKRTMSPQPGTVEKENAKKLKTGLPVESRIADLKGELLRLTKENESLNRVIKEYNGIQREYNSLKHGMLKVYKIRNYPGYDKSKQESAAIQGVLNTEQVIAAYAFEKFLKPILVIADANKNSPARTSAADKEKILDLLVSLSLLYIEYLYLRVNDLSIGGKMIERIRGFEKGNGLDASLLKKLDTEFGSRALVIKLALKDAGLDHLVYPVFDETNLNN